MPFRSSPPSQPILIFLHTQKCGGSTLQQIIKKNYSRWVNVNDWKHKAGWGMIEKYNAMTSVEQKERTELLERYDVIMGHFPYGIHTMVSRPSTTISMVREPVDRVVSLYEYWRGSHLADDAGPSMKAFMSTNPFGWALKDNHMVRVFCGAEGFKARNGELTRAHLEKAKKNMEECAFVGLAEQFDESVSVLQEMYGWKNISYTSKNVNKKRKNRNVSTDIDPDVLNAMEPFVEFDKELYAYAVELFHARVCEPLVVAAKR